MAIWGGTCAILQGRMDDLPRDAPVLIVNPASDVELAGLARRLTTERTWTPETLQAELRLTFPKVVVHSRDLSGETTQVWYVYREGRWISSEPPDRLLSLEVMIDARD
jgi:hypothetical protein